MTEPVDPRRLAAESVFNAIVDARRVAGDASLCDALDQLGTGAGQNRYRYAAAAIRGLAPGRPSIDDAWALRRILKYPPNRRREAVGIVAQDLESGADASSNKVKSTARRLRRKLENQTDEIILSISPAS